MYGLSLGRVSAARRNALLPIYHEADRDLLDARVHLVRSATRVARSSALHTLSRAGLSQSTWAR